MKRIVTINSKKFVIEGHYDPRQYWNYRVYDMAGNLPFEAEYISVRGKKSPLCVEIAFQYLRKAKRWLEDGCPVRQGLMLIWAVHSDQARALLDAAEEECHD